MVWQICKQKVAEIKTSKDDFLGKFCNKYLKWFLHRYNFSRSDP